MRGVSLGARSRGGRVLKRAEPPAAGPRAAPWPARVVLLRDEPGRFPRGPPDAVPRSWPFPPQVLPPELLSPGLPWRAPSEPAGRRPGAPVRGAPARGALARRAVLPVPLLPVSLLPVPLVRGPPDRPAAAPPDAALARTPGPGPVSAAAGPALTPGRTRGPALVPPCATRTAPAAPVALALLACHALAPLFPDGHHGSAPCGPGLWNPGLPGPGSVAPHRSHRIDHTGILTPTLGPDTAQPGHSQTRTTQLRPLPWWERPQLGDVRRRPTLPRGPPRSTIGAEGLNFRVRNGTGCFPFAMATETLWRCVDRTGQD